MNAVQVAFVGLRCGWRTSSLILFEWVYVRISTVSCKVKLPSEKGARLNVGLAA